jgi:HEAT repeat protein
MTSVTAAGLAVLLGWSAVAAAPGVSGGQPESYEAALADLRNPNSKARIRALRALADDRRREAVAAMATLLLDGDDHVQVEAIDAILRLYVVDDLRGRVWGIPAEGGRPRALAEAAYEAGPLAVIPTQVSGDVLANLSAVVRQDDRSRTRILAAYALGVLGSPYMGAMDEDVERQVSVDLVYALQHPSSSTRQVAARTAGRVFRYQPGVPASVAVGDGLIGAMNDSDRLLREWAMDSIGRMKYERAVQALTDHASFYGRGEEGGAALHALARIAHPSSSAVFRALLNNNFLPYRVIAIEGLGRLGECQLGSIADAVATANDSAVALAGQFADFLCGQGDISRIAEELDRRSTAIQARVYLEEIGTRNPDSLAPLLRSEDADVRLLAARIVGVSGDVRQEQALQPLLQDSEAAVVEAATESISRLRAYGGTAPLAR